MQQPKHQQQANISTHNGILPPVHIHNVNSEYGSGTDGTEQCGKQTVKVPISRCVISPATTSVSQLDQRW